ncbi:hypothetical protein OY671_012062, partial [Metschnikowia pulcherrima]
SAGQRIRPARVGNASRAPGGRHPVSSRVLDRHRDRFADREPPAQRRGFGPSGAALGADPRVRPDRPVDRHQRLRGAHRWRLHGPVPRHPRSMAYPDRSCRDRGFGRRVRRAALCDTSGRQPFGQALAGHRCQRCGQRWPYRTGCSGDHGPSRRRR